MGPMWAGYFAPNHVFSIIFKGFPLFLENCRWPLWPPYCPLLWVLYCLQVSSGTLMIVLVTICNMPIADIAAQDSLAHLAELPAQGRFNERSGNKTTNEC